MTYLEAISAWQQRGFDALKVAQSTQIISLRTALECAAAVTAARSQTVYGPTFVSDMTALMTTFTFQLFDQQVAYAKQVADTITGPRNAGGASLPAIVESGGASLPAIVESGGASLPAIVESGDTATGMLAAPESLPALPSGEAVAELVSVDAPALETLVAAQSEPEMLATAPSVSEEFSIADPPATTTASGQAKPAPFSSARASAKPPKAPSVSSQRRVRRGPK